ncbi:unnamed protein product [Moneuplotes crassus]|uniref:Uncharacterized protein n=1 Tax=Euplotes crassus TaxID=5936 RepID=A0AAD1UUW3_EUPCR|nr:unnamed protein product [Moneuplotes crassus]
MNYKCSKKYHCYHKSCLKSNVTNALLSSVNPTKCDATNCKAYLEQVSSAKKTLAVRNILDPEHVPLHSIVQMNQSLYQSSILYYCSKCDIIKVIRKTRRLPNLTNISIDCHKEMYDLRDVWRMNNDKNLTENSRNYKSIAEQYLPSPNNSPKFSGEELPNFLKKAMKKVETTCVKCTNCNKWKIKDYRLRCNCKMQTKMILHPYLD